MDAGSEQRSSNKAFDTNMKEAVWQSGVDVDSVKIERAKGVLKTLYCLLLQTK